MLSDGLFQEADAIFRQAIKESTKSGKHNVYVIPNYAWLVTALRLQAENLPDYAARQKKQLIRRATMQVRVAQFFTFPFRHLRPHLYRELGLLSAMSGRGWTARRYFAKSLKHAKKIGAEFESELTKSALSRLIDPASATETIRFPDYQRLMLEGKRQDSSTDAIKTSVSLADR